MSRSVDNYVKCDEVEKCNKEIEESQLNQQNDSDTSSEHPKAVILVNGVDEKENKVHEEESLKCPISLVLSPNGSDDSNEVVAHSQLSAPLPERKPSRNLEEIDKTLDELNDLAEDAFLTAQLAQGHQTKIFDKLFETNNVFLKKCETVPEDLTKQQFSDEDGILEEVEEAVRDAEERQYEPNHVSVMLDTECSSDDDGGSQRYNALGKIENNLASRLNESGTSLRNISGHRMRARVSSVCCWSVDQMRPTKINLLFRTQLFMTVGPSSQVTKEPEAMTQGQQVSSRRQLLHSAARFLTSQ